MTGLFTVCTPRLFLRPYDARDAAVLVDIHQRNRSAFAPYMPQRAASYFTLSGQRAQIDHDQSCWASDAGYAFAIVREGHIVGRAALSNVVRGAWQNATLGYWVDRACQSQGFASEAVKGVLTAAFEQCGLHRVQAAVMPRNRPSLHVVKNAGFHMEGRAPKYLKINGQWEDHLIFGFTRERHSPSSDYRIRR